MYNKNVSEKVQALSEKLAKAANADEFFDIVTEFYKAYGVGMFGLNKAFRISATENGKLTFNPINNMDKVVLDDLIGYEIQKKKLVENTENFVQGRKAIMLFYLVTVELVSLQVSRLSLMNIMTRLKNDRDI